MIISLAVLVLSVIIASLMSSLVLWKRSVYFGDALSHSSILAVVLAAKLDANVNFTLLIFALIFSGIIWFLQSGKMRLGNVSNAVATYFFVSAAMIFGKDFEHEFDFSQLLFGDVLNVEFVQVVSLLIILTMLLIFLNFGFQQFVFAIVDPDAARIEGIKTKFLEFIFLILLALSIALLTRLVGIFLASALLVLPSLIARNYASTASQMICLSLIIGILSMFPTLIIAKSFNFELSPVFILVLSLIFLLSSFLKKQQLKNDEIIKNS